MADKNKAVSDCSSNQDGVSMDSSIQPTIQVYPELSTVATCRREQLPDRFIMALEFENRVYDWLLHCDNIRAVTKTGYEHMIPDQRFRDIFRNSHNPIVNQFRYSPDFLIISNSGKPCYIECKASLHVERDAYTHYIALDAITPTWLIIQSNSGVFWQRVSSIEFVDSLAHVAGFPVPFPVDPDGWIAPISGSGHSSCPFRVVDLDSMAAIDLECAE